MVKRKLILALALLGAVLTIGAVRARAATITVQPDRNPVSLNESFSLTFTAHGSVDDDPDFGPLKENFQILGQSKGSQINIINGHFSRLTRWTLEVMAKRAGALAIPPIHFGGDTSAAGSVTVTRTATAQAGSGSHSRDLFLTVSATPQNPYVQAQVIYTVRLFRRVDLNNATLSVPKLTSGDAIIEKLGKANQYQTRRNGRVYAVIERKYAIFPQQSGAVTVAPVDFRGQVVENDPSRSSGFGAIDQFNNFFNHFNDIFDQKRVHVERLASAPVTLKVRPLPAAFTGRTWLPAQKLELKSHWSDDPSHWQVGVPITRTLTLRAAGLTAGQLPKLAPALSPGLKQYPDEPSLKLLKQSDGVVGRRREKIAIMPSRAGTYTLPAIAIPWWNTTTDRLEVARLPARVIHVAGGTGSAAGPPGPAAASTSPKAPSAAPSPSPPSAKPAHQPPPTPAVSAPGTSGKKANPWLWISLLLAIGWTGSLAALVLVRRRRRKKGANRPRESSSSVRPVSPGRAWERLRQACAAGEPRAVRDTLLAWAQLRWPHQAPATLEEVGSLCHPEAADEISRLGAHLYGRRSAEPWTGEPLWQALAKPGAADENDDRSAPGGLEPLYKL